MLINLRELIDITDNKAFYYQKEAANCIISSAGFVFLKIEN